MRIKDFKWDDENVSHIARHNIDPDEVEEACYQRPFVLKGREGRYLVYGQAEDGRYLLVVGHYLGQGVFRVITARDMSDSERRLYKSRS